MMMMIMTMTTTMTITMTTTRIMMIGDDNEEKDNGVKACNEDYEKD